MSNVCGSRMINREPGGSARIVQNRSFDSTDNDRSMQSKDPSWFDIVVLPAHFVTQNYDCDENDDDDSGFITKKDRYESISYIIN